MGGIDYTIQCNEVRGRKLGAWSLKSGRSNRYAQLYAMGVYVPDFVPHGSAPVPPAGIVTLEIHFVEGDLGAPAGLLTDLAEDGSHLEVSLSFPVSMLDWADRLLSQASAAMPMIIVASADADAKHRLRRLDLKLSEPRLID